MITVPANINLSYQKLKTWFPNHYATSTVLNNATRNANWNVSFDCIFTSTPSTAQFFLMDYLSSNPYCRRGIQLNTNGTIGVKGMTSGGYGYMSANDSRNIADGLPHHVNVARNGGTYIFTIDGVAVSVGNGWGDKDMIGTCNYFTIGRHSWATSTISNSTIPSYYLWNINVNGYSTTGSGTLVPGNDGSSSILKNINGTTVFTSNSSGYWGTQLLTCDFKQTNGG